MSLARRSARGRWALNKDSDADVRGEEPGVGGYSGPGAAVGDAGDASVGGFAFGGAGARPFSVSDWPAGGALSPGAAQ